MIYRVSHGRVSWYGIPPCGTLSLLYYPVAESFHSLCPAPASCGCNKTVEGSSLHQMPISLAIPCHRLVVQSTILHWQIFHPISGNSSLIPSYFSTSKLEPYSYMCMVFHWWKSVPNIDFSLSLVLQESISKYISLLCISAFLESQKSSSSIKCAIKNTAPYRAMHEVVSQFQV